MYLYQWKLSYKEFNEIISDEVGHKTRLAEIYAVVSPFMRKQGIEDITINKIAFLRGMRNSWLEDNTDDDPEKLKYLITLQMEIDRLYRTLTE